jgi:DNA-binding CsgD family transcriptional regulator
MVASGDAERAGDVALGAAAAEDELGARIAAFRSRTLCGRVLALAGRKDDAIVQLERAQRELSSCGAARFADEPARELRRFGRRVTRTGHASGPMGLTPRELEVAQLVASGKTNREIAAELFLSERTIETHLSNVFTKLGVSSRAAVASAGAIGDGSRGCGSGALRVSQVRMVGQRIAAMFLVRLRVRGRRGQ